MQSRILRTGLIALVMIMTIFVALIFLFIPRRHPQNAREAQRRYDIRLIGDMLQQYKRDHNNTLPPGIPTDTPGEICSFSQSDCNGYVDLSVLGIITQEHHDPITSAQSKGTGYFIVQNNITGTFTVSAPLNKTEKGGRKLQTSY